MLSECNRVFDSVVLQRSNAMLSMWLNRWRQLCLSPMYWVVVANFSPHCRLPNADADEDDSVMGFLLTYNTIAIKNYTIEWFQWNCKLSNLKYAKYSPELVCCSNCSFRWFWCWCNAEFGVVGITTPMAAFVPSWLFCPLNELSLSVSCRKLRRGIGRTGQQDRVFSGSEKLSILIKTEKA